MSMRIIEYYYYKNKQKVNGKTRLSDKQTRTIHFDNEKYIDERNNYYNVISDHLQDINEPTHQLTVTRVGNVL